MSTMGNERGAAMLVALAILLMMGLIGTAAIETSVTDMAITDNYRQDARAFYIAEGGAEHAFGVLRDSIDWRTGLRNVYLGGGEYSVRILDSDSLAALDDTILLIATGTRSGAESVIQLKLVQEETNPFRWAAFADSSFELGGNTLTDSYDSDSGTYAATKLNEDGDIGSNGHVDIYGTADIYGDASTASNGDMDITGSATVSGDTTTTADLQTFDPVTNADMTAAQAVNAAPAGLSGTYTYSGGALTVKPNKTMTLASGTYYFTSMDLKGTVNIAAGATVKIYTDGDISMNSQADVNMGGTPKQLQIFSKGANVTFNGGGNIKSLVYAPDTEFKFTGHAELYGSFIMGTAKNAGGSGFHYDRSLRNWSAGGVGDLIKVAWIEL